jgi:hypothetical protein
VTARELKDLLARRYPGAVVGGLAPPWTVIEEYRGIDLLAWSAWSSVQQYARIGHEVKVSRADLRKELLAPYKRSLNVEWCNEFFFAVPEGLLSKEEIVYQEPEWEEGDWVGERCPGYAGQQCSQWWRKKKHRVKVPIPCIARYPNTYFDDGWQHIICPTCKGKGVTIASRVEREAPTCWVPRDVGLIVVSETGSRIVKPSPKRKEVKALGVREIAQLVRWVSMRPDPRHRPNSGVEPIPVGAVSDGEETLRSESAPEALFELSADQIGKIAS